MPSTVPCLGCGFTLDSNGYLIRRGETEKINAFGNFNYGFKYCDPGLERSWDVPFHMPWGLTREATTILNIAIPFGPPFGADVYSMPVPGAFIPANSHYAPYRRLRWEGWIETASPGGVAVYVACSANNVALNLSEQLADGATFGSSMPISIGMSGPSVGPWTPFWNTGQPAGGSYAQFRMRTYKTGGVAGDSLLTRLALSIIDDGPAVGIFYSTEARFWPTTLPYP